MFKKQSNASQKNNEYNQKKNLRYMIDEKGEEIKKINPPYRPHITTYNGFTKIDGQ